MTQSYTQLLHHHSQIRKRVNWPVNFNGFRVLASLLYWCRSRDVNQTLHDVWPSLGLVRYVYVSRGSCPLTEFFKVQNSFCIQVFVFSYIGSVTARHSSSGHQPNCGIEQRAPPIFGRAAITLGMGPRSSWESFWGLVEIWRMCLFYLSFGVGRTVGRYKPTKKILAITALLSTTMCTILLLRLCWVSVFHFLYYVFSLTASATSSFHHHVSLCLQGPFDIPRMCCAVSIIIMAALRSRCGHYIFVLWFLFLSSSNFFSSPNLSGHWVDVYHTSTHGVALVRI